MAYAKKGRRKMRMWMVDPKLMCTQHLLGEHVECHMFKGTIIRERSVDGYLDGNLFEPLALVARHNELVEEMLKRKMTHSSELVLPDNCYAYLGEKVNTKIDKERAKADLFNRCKLCNQK